MKTQICLNLDSELHHHFKILCAEKKVSMTTAMRKLISWSIKKEKGIDIQLDDNHYYDGLLSKKVVEKLKKDDLRKFEKQEKYRLVIEFYTQDLSYREISKRCGIPHTTVARLVKKYKRENGIKSYWTKKMDGNWRRLPDSDVEFYSNNGFDVVESFDKPKNWKNF